MKQDCESGDNDDKDDNKDDHQDNDDKEEEEEEVVVVVVVVVEENDEEEDDDNDSAGDVQAVLLVARLRQQLDRAEQQLLIQAARMKELELKLEQNSRSAVAAAKKSASTPNEVDLDSARRGQHNNNGCRECSW